MMVITYVSFVILGAICVGVQYLAIKSRNFPVVGNNPIFLKFQYGYFGAYFLALAADWLQGPYLYQLYHHYGFQEDQIAVLYVCGYASAVLLGTWAPVAADRFGRQKLCVFFTIIYSLSCFLKLSRSYGILIIGRLLSGIATSVLFSTYEAWYVHEHIETHDFPREWIAVTFGKASVWNGVLAIAAGVVANICAEWLRLGPVAPFMMAIPFLILSGIVVMSQWKENYGKQHLQLKKSCMEGLKTIVTDPRTFLIGAIQSSFESVMCIVIFLWTPILAPAKPSLGIVFSSFMVCVMIGSGIFQLLSHKRVPVVAILTGAIAVALTAAILCVFSAHPDKMNRNLAFIAFLLFETASGVYFPAMGYVRTRIIPEAHLSGVMNWFRIPMNLIACGVLMLLHNNIFRHGNSLLFAVCAGLLGLALLCVLGFQALIRDDEELKEGETGENEPLLVLV